MNIEAEKKRICRLESYLQLLKANERAIEVCKNTLPNTTPRGFGNLHEFYTQRLERMNKLKTWLENRYINILIR